MRKLILAPIFVVMVVLGAQTAFAHHSNDNGGNGVYQQGVRSGHILWANGGSFPSYDACVNDPGNQNGYDGYVSDYCSGLIAGYERIN